jgi:hypothetical protein
MVSTSYYYSFSLNFYNIKIYLIDFECFGIFLHDLLMIKFWESRESNQLN